MTTVISYQQERQLSVEEFAEILNRSTLGQRRPVQDRPRLEKMIAQSDVVITARDSCGQLVGIARTLTDYAYCAYLADLAVDVAFQRQGIGRTLIQRTQSACGPQAKLILLAAPAAAEYYPHIGFQQHHSCWVLDHTAVATD